MKQINLSGPINQFGYGVVGTNTLIEMAKQGYDVSLFPTNLSDVPTDIEALVEQAKDASKFYNKWAPSIRIAQQFHLAQHVGKGVHAAITYFERSKLYDFEINHLQNQDVVIASSKWMLDLLQDQIRGPKLAIARPGVDMKIFQPGLVSQWRPASTASMHSHSHSPFNDFSNSFAASVTSTEPRIEQSSPTIFIAVGKWEVRKGHDVLPHLFHRAFSPKDNFKLILVTSNPFLPPEAEKAWAKTFEFLGDKVEIHSKRLPSQQSVAQCMAQADCGLFMSRAEGWNLDAAEMLAMGKHILITNFSAHTEFANAENAWLVDIDELEPCNDGIWFNGFGEWAKLGRAQLDQAISHLQRIHSLKQAGQLPMNYAGIETMKRMNWSVFVQSVMEAVA
ncbi:MAG: glycosyltransferase [Pirellula sp.]